MMHHKLSDRGHLPELSKAGSCVDYRYPWLSEQFSDRFRAAELESVHFTSDLLFSLVQVLLTNQNFGILHSTFLPNREFPKMCGSRTCRENRSRSYSQHQYRDYYT